MTEMGNEAAQRMVHMLFERDREIGVLEEALVVAGRGTGSVVVVEGPAGIGKTALLAHTRAAAGQAGFLVRAARGGEMERDMPFGIARQLFEPLLASASDDMTAGWLSGPAHQARSVLSDEGPTTSMVDAFAPIHGLYWLVANLCEAAPVALVIDDAQWSDASSLRFASFLARRIGDLPGVMVLGVRTGEPREPPELAAIRLESTLVRPQVLSRAAVSKLISTRSEAPPSDDLVDACASAAAGNPFLVMELLRELEAQPEATGPAVAPTIADLAPERVSRAVQVRLLRLGDDAVALARAISVLGRAPQLRHAAQLAGLDHRRAAPASDVLRAAEILAPRRPIEFVHPVVRRAVYLAIPEAERADMHRAAAGILFDSGGGAAQVAAHLLACPPNGDEWVVDRLEEAARVALAEGGYDGVVTYLERALAEPPDDEATLLLLLGRALSVTDVFRAPEVLGRVAVVARDDDLRLEALTLLAYAHIQTGNLSHAAATCNRAIHVLRDDDRELRLGLEAEWFFLVAASSGLDGGISARLEGLAAEVGTRTTAERVVRQALALHRFLECAPLAEVLELAYPFPDLPWRVGATESPLPTAVGKVLAWSGRWDEAQGIFERLTDQRRGEGRILAASNGHSFLSEALRLAGRLHEAEAEALTAQQIAAEAGGFSSYTWAALMNLSAVLLARGNVDGFRDVIGDVDLSAGPLQIPVNPWPLELRGLVHLATGRLDAAAEDLMTLGEALEDIGWRNPSYPPWRQEACEALAALGRFAEAEEVISVAHERAVVFDAPHVHGTVLRARAAIEPRSRAIETLRASVELLTGSGPPHELARALVAMGAALRRAGERAAAREALAHGLDLAIRCGAGGVEDAARQELSMAGGRRPRVERSGLGALTASEMKVARMAADGLTNREIADRLFVTVRTVETHLTHVYEKLGIDGRRALSRALEGDAG